jgi:AcrR family transcriptional regulator
MSEKKGRDPGNRRTQIVDSALDLISNHGIAGATTARIAADVGVSEPALYRHFENKQKILLAALDEASSRLVEFTMAAGLSIEDGVERLRVMSAAFYDFVMSHPAEFRVLFEAVGATRDEEMRLALRDKISSLLGVVETVLVEGVDQGAFRADLDTSLAAWEIVSLGIALYLASILGLGDVLPKDKALTAVERLLASITAEDGKGKENIK